MKLKFGKGDFEVGYDREHHTEGDIKQGTADFMKNNNAAVVQTSASHTRQSIEWPQGQCRYCQRWFVRSHGLTSHEQFCRTVNALDHKKTGNIMLKIKTEAPDQCGGGITQQIKTKAEADINVKQESNPSIKNSASDNKYAACTLCNKLFSEEKYLDKHVKLKHPNHHSTSTGKISCSVCEEKFDNMTDYTHHLNVHLQDAKLE